jgi:hypothetical protein
VKDPVELAKYLDAFASNSESEDLRICKDLIFRNAAAQLRELDAAVKDGRISLRDQFAASALLGVFTEGRGPGGDRQAEYAAKRAYELADAMLKARVETKDNG